MESVTATVRGASAPLARARAALVCGRARLGPRRVVAAAGLAAPGRRRRALVAVASLQEPLPSRAQEGHLAVAPPQADEEGEVHGNGPAAAETSSPPAVPGKTVRVRFVLEKPCAFEQGVYLVGDDPALGLWDPVNAISLEWAESHGWILEKDLPANKLIEFKFLLPDSVGKLHWQNGPNRSFQTGETTNMLVIYEDWGDVKNQKIAEEERVPSVGMEEAVVSDGIEEGVVSDGIEEGVVSVGIEKGVVSDGKEEAIVVSDDSESGKGTVLEHELQMDDNREVKEYESVVAEEDEKSAGSINASVQVDSLETNEEASLQEPMLQKEPEIIDEPHEVVGMENSSAFCADENSAEKTEGENILSEDGVPVENGLAYEHDLLWGWKALQQLLLSLGSKMDTT